jgi:alpha-1,3-rhamnosyl/mannosyltransferase
VRVGIDVSPLARTQAGTARYLTGLLRGLRGLRADVEELFFRGGATALADLVWYPALLPIRARSVDLLHCPGIRAPFRAFVPVVLTVHDIAFLRHPGTFPAWSRTYSRLALPRLLRSASHVIVLSEFTRREVEKAYGVPERKLRVVPAAAADIFTSDGDAASGDYVLAVGTIEPRKNLVRLVQAAGRAGVELRVVGAPGWGGVQATGDGVRWLGHVPDDELARLYRGALCLAYPSLYEGFGLPVLEGMSCGTAVVTSAVGATAEIADGAAVLVDPYDVEAIAAGIEDAISRRTELSARGLERARGFSWSATARATLAVYEEAAL